MFANITASMIHALTRLTIGPRMMVGFAGLLAIMSALSINSIIQVTATADSTEQFYLHPYTTIKSLGDIRIATDDAFDAVQAMVGKQGSASPALIGDLFAQAHQAADIAQRQFLGPKADTALLQEQLAAYEGQLSESARLAAAGQAASASAALAQANTKLHQIYATSKKIRTFAAGKAVAFRAKSAQAAISLRQTTGMLLIAGLTIGLVIATLIGRSIARPLRSLQDTMTMLAKGIYEVRIEGLDSRDEVGSMARALDSFKDKLIESERLQADQATLRQQAEEEKRTTIRAVAEELDAALGDVIAATNASAAQVEAAAHIMTSAIEQTNMRAANVASASEEASANVQTVASSAEELSVTLASISAQVEKSAAIARQATDAASNTNKRVTELTGAATTIGSVIALINNIASQTNLLALNATIEAARAGDAGRGFAVVASEVKSLASQTASATEDIETQIASIQGATTDMVEAIGGIVAIVAEMDVIAATIAGAIEQQRAATHEIASSVQQAAMGTQDVATNIVGVSTAAQESGAAASDVLGVSRNLGAQASKLGAVVEGFVQRMRAA